MSDKACTKINNKIFYLLIRYQESKTMNDSRNS